MQMKDDSNDPLLNNLEHANFSRAARDRNALKARILQQTERAASRRSHPLRLAIEIGGLAILGFGFLFTVSSLVNNRPAAPASTQPAPSPTLTLTPTGVPPTSQPTAAPQGAIDLSSSVDAVRIAISQPSWKTLWVEAEIDYAPFTTDNNQPDKRLFSQAWLEKNGRGLVLSTDFIRNSFDFNLDFGVNSVALLNGGNLVKYDHTTNQVATTPVPGTAEMLGPLAGVSPALDLVYPGFLYILSSEPRPLRMETTLGRPALVADWGNSRLWVDSQTGLLLRAERYSGEVGNSPLDAVLFLRQALIDPPLDDAVFTPAHLNELTFRPAPGKTQSAITPSPFADSSPQGWVYFQAAAQAPFEWKVYRMPAACLVDGSSCPEPQQLPGNPNLQITGLYWTPDGSLGVYSDTNNNQIVGYDPQTHQFPRLLQGFFQPQLIWSQDGSQVAALTDGVDAYDMGLVVIQRDGWTVRDVPTILRGEKQVYGWLDDHTLAVKLPNNPIFKGTPPAQGWAAAGTQPGIYRVNVTTGRADLLPINAANPYGMSLSPDGKQFAYYDSNFNITVASTDGKQSHTLGYTGNSPTWSPDGKWILFQTYANDDKTYPSLTITTLYVVRPDGSGLKKMLSSTATLETAWSPDDTVLLVSEFDNPGVGSYSISTFDMSTGTLKKLELPAMASSGVLNFLGWTK